MTPDGADLAESLLREGKPKEALEAARKALAADPADWRAELALARALIERGQAAFAVLPLQRLAARRADSADVHTTLAFAQRLSGDPEAARGSLDAALRAEPGWPGAAIERSALELESGDAGAAVRTLEEAAAGQPDNPELQFALARAHLGAGAPEQARDAFARALAGDASLERRFLNHALWFRDHGDSERARRLLGDGLALRPDDPELAHMLRALDGGPEETRASDDYLRRHFDNFAPVFDDWLTGRLGYTVPQQLAERLGRAAGEPAASLDVLDAGCGTGLAGPLLRPFARSLVGVDISEGMLARAEELGVYDELLAEELTAYLERSPEAFHAVVAADVLVYFGDLTGVVASIARSLRPGGVALFTVEAGEREHELRPSGRWAHRPSEVEGACAAAGLEVELEPAELRQEGGRPVHGLICEARKRADRRR